MKLGTQIQLHSNSKVDEHLYSKNDNDQIWQKEEFYRYNDFEKNLLDLSKNVKFDSTCIFNLDTSLSDMISDFILKIQLPNLLPILCEDDTYVSRKYVNDVGYALIKNIKIINGDEVLLDTDGQLMYLYTQLYKMKTNSVGVSKMIAHYNSLWTIKLLPQTNNSVLYIDIPFLKNKFFPIFKCKNNTFQIHITLNSLDSIIYKYQYTPIKLKLSVLNGGIRCYMLTDSKHSNFDYCNLELLYFSYNLNTIEKNLYIKNSYQSLITQFDVQHRPLNNRINNIDLHFTQPITQFIIVVKENVSYDNIKFKYINIDSISLTINDYEFYNKKNARYFRFFTKHKHIVNDYIYVIPFSLYPDEFQPSGSIRLQHSKVNNIMISIADQYIKKSEVYIYSFKYNLLNVSNEIKVNKL